MKVQMPDFLLNVSFSSCRASFVSANFFNFFCGGKYSCLHSCLPKYCILNRNHLKKVLDNTVYLYTIIITFRLFITEGSVQISGHIHI